MNLRCKVCGEKAAGFHFGAFTCEGCKSFFGRCCNNMSLIGECRNNKECIIDKKNRTACKACRLQKCLIVGMSKNGSRYGRRSNWFKQFFQEGEHLVGGKLETVDRGAGEKKANAAYSSSGYFARRESDEKALSAEFSSQTSISSHLYLNYFPQYNFNRLISCGGRDTKFWLPNSTVPLGLLNNNEIDVQEYFGKFLGKRNIKNDESDERENVNRIGSRALERGSAENADDPIDLSRRRNEFEEAYGPVDSRKTLPLDLSVK